MVVELHAIALDLDGGLGVALHQAMEVGFELLDEGTCSNSRRVGRRCGRSIDGALCLALAVQRAKMPAEQGIKLFLLSNVHL